MLQVSFQTLSVRLSYNDIRLFTAIINSMPQQLLNASQASQPKNTSAIGLYREHWPSCATYKYFRFEINSTPFYCGKKSTVGLIDKCFALQLF